MSLNITILAAGAAGMYCGSCLRDNALAASLLQLGHRVTLLPLYTPLRTDTPDVSNPHIFYGGINVYLQHASKLFRITPRIFDWLFDRPFLLTMAGSMGAGTHPSKLASLTRDILLGYNGPTHKELRRLIAFLASDIQPNIITLPNLMFAGMAQAFVEKLHCPVICELTGEDLFLDAMAESDRNNIRALIRQTTPHIAQFVATSHYYAQKMSTYLDLPPEKITIIYPGLPGEMLDTPKSPSSPLSPQHLNLTYLARICPEKGLDQLADAFLLLQKLPHTDHIHLHYAGYLGPAYKAWHHALQQRLHHAGLAARVHYHGTVDLAGKISLLDNAHLFCVPTHYPESKGIFVLEALSRGAPVLAPNHGSFPEIAQLTSALDLTPPHNPQLLAEKIHSLLHNPQRLQSLSQNARPSIETHFTARHMATQFAKLCIQLQN